MEGPLGGNRVRLRGVSRGPTDGDGALVRAVEVRAPGRAPLRLPPRGSFDLIVESDRRVRIDCDGAEILAPIETSKMAWSEAAAGVAAGLDAELPPFEEVELRVGRILGGDPVEVWGEVGEHGFVGVGGYRDAAVEQVHSVRAALLAGGAGAGRYLDDALARRAEAVAAATPRAPDPRRSDPGSPRWRAPLKAWWFAGVAAAGVVASLVLARGAVRIAYAVQLAATVVQLRPRLPVPSFRSRAAVYRGGTDLTWVAGALSLGAAGGMLEVSDQPLTIEVSAVAAIGMMALATLLSQWSSHRYLAALLGTRARSGDGPADWAAVEGEVADRTPAGVRGQQVALASVEDYTEGLGSDPDVLQSARFVAQGGFEVVPAGGGAAVDIDPAEILWASSVASRRDGSRTYEVTEAVPVGGLALAAGRLVASDDGGVRLRSHGTRPALLLATSRLGDPRAVARRILWQRRITLAAHLAAAAALVYLAGWLG